MKTLSKLMLSFAVTLLSIVTASAQLLTPIYSFDNNINDSGHDAGLLLSSNALYAATAGAGIYGGSPRDSNLSGAVFKLKTDGTGFTNLYIFSPVAQFDRNSPFTNTDGANSQAQLILAGNRLYGTTEAGGIYGSGTVFAINLDGTGFTNLYNFGPTVYTGFYSNIDGALPTTGLTLSGNTLYGTTSTGGQLGGGTIFAIQTDGTGFTSLYSFSSDYALNRTGLKSSLIVSQNTLYGTTAQGGSSGNGTVYALRTDGTSFTNLHTFSVLVSGRIALTNNDGSTPSAALVLSGNTLYGTTTGGGTAGKGTVFAVNTDGSGVKSLYSFDSTLNGRTSVNANTRMILSGSTLYGTLENWGAQNQGAVFAINTDGTHFTTVHSFTQRTANSSGVYTNKDGVLPVGDLILAGSKLYGMTTEGGANGYGTIYVLDLAAPPGAIQFTASPTNGFARLTTQFSAPAADADGNAIVSWNWSFGDGSTNISTAQNPTYTYTNAGTFLPVLACVNNSGSPVTGSGPAITVNPLPPIQFTATPTNSFPAPVTVSFRSPTADAGGNTIISWNWNFGDGSSSTDQNPSHIYTNTGTFFPTLSCLNLNRDTVAGSGPAISVLDSLLLNGSFETGTFTNWEQSGFSNPTHVTTSSTFAHSGKYGAELLAPSAGGTFGFLSQTLATVSGGSYLISLWLNSPFGSTPNDFQVSWNGETLLDLTNIGAIGWTNIQLKVTAIAETSTLKLGYLTGLLYFGLDAIGIASMDGGGSAPPAISTIAISGVNIVLSATGAQANQTYDLLMASNLGEPLNQWARIATTMADADGNLSISLSNAIGPAIPLRFYILELE